MPVYDYRCPDGHTHEEVFKADDVSDSVDCDEHGCPWRARRVWSVPSMPLMGGQTRTRRPNPGDSLPVH